MQDSPHLPIPDADDRGLAPRHCPRCSRPVAISAAYCQWCGEAVAGRFTARTTAPLVTPAIAPPRRARAAGWTIIAGGAGVILSTLLPWFSWLGIAGPTVPVRTFAILGTLGTATAYFGVRATKGCVTRPVMVALWLLAALAAFVTVGAVDTVDTVNTASYGAVTPAIGLYLVIVAMVATIAGTVLLQATRRRPRRR